MGFSGKGAVAVAGCCTLVSFSWHCSPPGLYPGAQAAAVAVAVAVVD